VHWVTKGVREEQEVETRCIERAGKFLPILERRESRRVAALVRPAVTDERGREFLEGAENELLFDAASLSTGGTSKSYARKADPNTAGIFSHEGFDANPTSRRPVVAALRAVTNHGGFGNRANSPPPIERGKGRKGP
jgi:hypothetical protein